MSRSLFERLWGAALGWYVAALSGLRKINIRLYEKRILFTGNFGYTHIKHRISMVVNISSNAFNVCNCKGKGE